MATSTRKTRGTGEKAKASKAKASKKARAARPTTLQYIREAIGEQQTVLSSLVGGATIDGNAEEMFAYSAEYAQYGIDLQLELISKGRISASDLRNAAQRVYQTGHKVSRGEADFSFKGKNRKVSPKKAEALRSAAQKVWQAARRVEQKKARFEH